MASTRLGHARPALELHRVRPALGDEPACVLDGDFVGGLVGHVGHVAHHERPGYRSGNRRGDLHHEVHFCREGGAVAEHAHRRGVAHEDHVHSRPILKKSRGVIVGGEERDFLAAGHHVQKIGNGQLLPLLHASSFSQWYPIRCGRPLFH
jgi:hypothetical protein